MKNEINIVHVTRKIVTPKIVDKIHGMLGDCVYIRFAICNILLDEKCVLKMKLNYLDEIISRKNIT